MNPGAAVVVPNKPDTGRAANLFRRQRWRDRTRVVAHGRHGGRHDSRDGHQPRSGQCESDWCALPRRLSLRRGRRRARTRALVQRRHTRGHAPRERRQPGPRALRPPRPHRRGTARMVRNRGAERHRRPTRTVRTLAHRRHRGGHAARLAGPGPVQRLHHPRADGHRPRSTLHGADTSGRQWAWPPISSRTSCR